MELFFVYARAPYQFLWTEKKEIENEINESTQIFQTHLACCRRPRRRRRAAVQYCHCCVYFDTVSFITLRTNFNLSTNRWWSVTDGDRRQKRGKLNFVNVCVCVVSSWVHLHLHNKTSGFHCPINGRGERCVEVQIRFRMHQMLWRWRYFSRRKSPFEVSVMWVRYMQMHISLFMNDRETSEYSTHEHTMISITFSPALDIHKSIHLWIFAVSLVLLFQNIVFVVAAAAAAVIVVDAAAAASVVATPSQPSSFLWSPPHL